MKKYATAVIIYTILLFVWSGFTQVLPWGIPTAQKITTQSKEFIKEIPNLIKVEQNNLTTDAFDKTFNNRISTYTTNNTFSWIITQPLQNDYSGYFINEIIVQFFVGALLTCILAFTIKLDLKTRLSIIFIMGFLAFTATYGQLMNWWRLPPKYALGVGLNLIAGWTLSSFIISKYILKTSKQTYE